MIRRLFRSGRRREAGAAALEFAGIVPLVIIGALVALQFGVVGWVMVSTNQAARDAARAASLGRDPAAAAQVSLPGSLVGAVSGGPVGGGYRYTVKVTVPSLVPGVSVGSVSRTVDMPDLR